MFNDCRSTFATDDRQRVSAFWKENSVVSGEIKDPSERATHKTLILRDAVPGSLPWRITIAQELTDRLDLPESDPNYLDRKYLASCNIGWQDEKVDGKATGLKFLMVMKPDGKGETLSATAMQDDAIQFSDVPSPKRAARKLANMQRWATVGTV